MKKITHCLALLLLILLPAWVCCQSELDVEEVTTEDVLIDLNANRRGAVLDLRQIGDSNESIVNQVGVQAATIIQDGMGNSNQTDLSGYGNSLLSVQNGNYNTMNLDVNGTFNNLRVRQDGNYNELNKTYEQVDNMNMYVGQEGNFNQLTIDLSEAVDGATLPSSIIQRNGGDITIEAVSDFDLLRSAPVNP